MKHKAGFANILGNPNVGKSTLMNALVGENLSIITSKAQTTRHRIMGIVNGDDFQLVYSDTPGIMDPAYKLHEAMLKLVRSAMSDADVLLLVTDIFEEPPSDEDNRTSATFFNKIKKSKVPILILLNKIDLGKQDEVNNLIEKWKAFIPAAEILAISALRKFNLQAVFQSVLNRLPESPAYFPKDALTDKAQRFFVSEIIREKIFTQFKKEIPYSTEVVVEEYKDPDEQKIKDPKNIVRIRAIIHTMRESQKGILLGHKGARIRQVGTKAREDLEKMIGKQVFLDLHVKVIKDWRDKEQHLRKFGY